MNLRVSFKSKAAEKIAKGLLVRAFNRSRQDGLKMQQEIEGRVHKIHKWAEEDRPLIEKFDAENAGYCQYIRGQNRKMEALGLPYRFIDHAAPKQPNAPTSPFIH